jgi:hypothetical protein
MTQNHRTMASGFQILRSYTPAEASTRAIPEGWQAEAKRGLASHLPQMATAERDLNFGGRMYFGAVEAKNIPVICYYAA